MTIMCIHVKELLYQAVMGRILVLECPLLGVHEPLWLRPFVSGIKYRCFPRT
jgi:hypothetical protein